MRSISFYSCPLQGWKPQTPPSCCWETTVVICLLSVLIIDSDSEIERERDRGRGSERPWLAERRRKKEEGGGVKKILHARLHPHSPPCTVSLKETHVHPERTALH